jgi:superfamily I DNA and RNA helicase
MQSKNIVTLSAAGSGKTTELIDKALSMKDKKRVLLCTYTNKNLEQLKELIYSKNKFIPQNVELLSWYVFLLQECVRPYQNKMGFDKKISGIEFSKKRCLKKEQYLNKDNNIYVDKISEFAFKCNEKTNGLVVNRLSAIYGYIMIDEFQDLSGYDLDLLDILFDSQNHIYITLIGDPRQATFSTNNAGKNRQYRKRNI